MSEKNIRTHWQPFYMTMPTEPQGTLPQTLPQGTLPTPAAPPAPASPAAPVTYSQADFFAALEKAREDEKGKLYGRLEKSDAELAELRKFRDEQEAAQKAEADRVAEAERKAREADMDAKALLEARQQEWDAKFSQVQDELARRDALLAKERERSELVAFIQRRVAEERDEIAPELTDYISGNTPEEVESAITTAKAKTASILEGVRQAQTQFRQEMPGVSLGSGNIGPVDQQGAQRQYTAEEIAAMPPGSPEYQKIRAAYGIDRAGRGHGLYG